MACRGPKARTAQNARRGYVGVIRHETLDSPCDLTGPARAEYDRLVSVLQAKGTLDRVDLVSIAECARIKVLLDQAHAATASGIDWDKAKLVAILSGQHRGRLRELGLTTRPCNSIIKANPVTGSERDEDENPWARDLKVS